MLLRAMTPQIIAVDEITLSEDVTAMCAAANCGVGLLATTHAGSLAELGRKALWRELLASEVFSRAVVIGREDGERVYRVEELSCSAGSA